MNELNSDLAINIIQFLNVIDSGRLAACAQRYYYLVHQYRKIRGPELVTISSWSRTTFEQRSASTVASQPIPKLQKAPNLVLAFNTSRSTLQDELPKYLPASTTVLGACAQSIQVNLGKDNVEHKSNASVMYASFPDAEFVPFALENADDELDELKKRLTSSTAAASDTNYWKAIIIYGCGHASSQIEYCVSSLQSTLPKATIVGGICNAGYVNDQTYSRAELEKCTIRQLRRIISNSAGPPAGTFLEKSEMVDHIIGLQNHDGDLALYPAEDCIFGVVLGGDAPVRSMVSRGVTSVTHGIPQPMSPYVIEEVTLTRPDDPDFLFQGNDLQPIHMITRILNRETDTSMTASELMAKTSNVAQFIGVKRPNEDGFELHMLSPYCQATQSYLIMTDGTEAQMESLENSEVDFFVLSGEACCEDMDSTVAKLKEQTQGEEILGAIMFSCNGRGPRRGTLIREDMADATRFSRVFPEVPCLGFYAGGEVGPQALAGNERVFQTGKAAVQGFTAVFCLFIVPIVEKLNYHLDDCQDNVFDFVRSRLYSNSGA